jgi:Fic family protein
MKYLSVVDIAQLWEMSERTIRNYCAQGKIKGAFRKGKTWNIPEDAKRPEVRRRVDRQNSELLEVLRREKRSKLHGGMYHKLQIELTYNSNHIEGSELTHDQTRCIYETNTIECEHTPLNIDDIVETANHFRCIDLMIDRANFTLSEPFIKQLHFILKSGTSDSREHWFAVGEYKKLPNEVGERETTLPEHVADEMQSLLDAYRAKKRITLDDIIEFHVRFETIHPFQDGNGRIGRLIIFKECLHWNIVPFIIYDTMKMSYYRGLQEWQKEKGFLGDTCLTAQDIFKQYLEYFRIPYTNGNVEV